MHAYTGYWSPAKYLDEARKRLARERELRTAHRKLAKQERLLVDLDRVLARVKQHKKASMQSSRHDARLLTLLRQWNRLVRMLEAV